MPPKKVSSTAPKKPAAAPSRTAAATKPATRSAPAKKPAPAKAPAKATAKAPAKKTPGLPPNVRNLPRAELAAFRRGAEQGSTLGERMKLGWAAVRAVRKVR